MKKIRTILAPAALLFAANPAQAEQPVKAPNQGTTVFSHTNNSVPGNLSRPAFVDPLHKRREDFKLNIPKHNKQRKRNDVLAKKIWILNPTKGTNAGLNHKTLPSSTAGKVIKA